MSLQLPQHPVLRSTAEACEQLGVIAMVLDRKWRAVYVSTELIDSIGLSDEAATAMLGQSPVIHAVAQRVVEMPPASRERWWEKHAAAMLYDVPPDDPDFDAVFGPLAELARHLEPQTPQPALVFDRELVVTFAHQMAVPLDVQDLLLRFHDDRGEFVGMLLITRPTLRDNLLVRLALGHAPMYERMFELREPGRRSAAILFADLEASGELSKTLPSTAYFRLIRSLTDV
jgi:hypothetical protein